MGVWALPALLNFLLAFFWFMSIKDIGETELLSAESRMVMFNVVSLQTSMGIIVNIFFSVIVIRMALDVFERGETSLASGMSVIGSRMSAVMGAVIVFGGSISIWVSLSMSSSDACFSMLCYFPLLMVCYWWMFALVILVSEGVKVREAFSASKEFAARRASMSFTMYIFILLGMLSVFDQMMNWTLTNISTSTVQASIFAAMSKAIIQWFLFPFLVVLIVSFYVKGKEAIRREIAAAFADVDENGEDEEEDEEDEEDENKEKAQEKSALKGCANGEKIVEDARGVKSENVDGLDKEELCSGKKDDEDNILQSGS